MKTKYLVGVTCCLFASSTLAQDKSPWAAEAEFGWVQTSGNTDTQTGKAKGKLTYTQTKWQNIASAEALNTKDKSSTTAERYKLKDQLRYDMAKDRYLYAIVTYEDDRFSGYDYRATESLGYGAKLINDPGFLLEVEGGPGARQSKLDNGDTESEGLVRLSGNLNWQLSEAAKLGQELTTEVGDEATITESVTSLQSQVNHSLAMKMSYTVKHTSDVPDGVKKTDRESTVTLVYSFK